MKRTVFFICCTLLFASISCKQKPTSVEEKMNANKDTITFFPVAEYIKQQINHIDSTPYFLYCIHVAEGRKDSTTIDLVVPVQYERNIVQLMAIIENFKVNPDSAAKIVINERTGTIVAGGDVVVSPVAISHADLTIEVKGDGGDKSGKPNTMYFMEKGTTLNELVKSLNAFGVGPEDLISIFQALKKDGALVGDIELI